jgi:hypothetical protein
LLEFFSNFIREKFLTNLFDQGKNEINREKNFIEFYKNYIKIQENEEFNADHESLIKYLMKEIN